MGCGTSWFMAEAYAALRERAGRRDRRVRRQPSSRPSAATTGSWRSRARARRPRCCARCERRARRSPRSPRWPDSPVAEAAEHAVVLDFADEQSVVQTVFATTALMLLRASLGERPRRRRRAGRRRARRRPRCRPASADAEQFTFLGHGWAYGVALEAALKMREAAQLWTESYPQLEYRHGPISIAAARPGGLGVRRPGRRPAPTTSTATGATVVDDDLDPVADLVRAQLLAVRRAEAAGLDPDRPRSLTRSVVLDADLRDPLRLPEPGDRRHLPAWTDSSPARTNRVDSVRTPPGRQGASTSPGCCTGSGADVVWCCRSAARSGANSPPTWPRSACRFDAVADARADAPHGHGRRRTARRPCCRSRRASTAGSRSSSGSHGGLVDADVVVISGSLPVDAPADAHGGAARRPRPAADDRRHQRPGARRRRWRPAPPSSSRTPTNWPNSPANATRAPRAREAGAAPGDRRRLARRGRHARRRTRPASGTPGPRRALAGNPTGAGDARWPAWPSGWPDNAALPDLLRRRGRACRRRRPAPRRGRPRPRPTCANSAAASRSPASIWTEP